MKKIKDSAFQLILAALAFLNLPSFSHAQSDGTQNDNFIFQILAPAALAGNYTEGECGFGVTINWGGEITEDLSGPAAWAYGFTGDSLNCDSTVTDLTGKIALVRRGGCEYGIKAYHAQQAGAIAVIFINHFNSALDNDCSVINMSLGIGGPMVNIPVIFLSRLAGEPIVAALASGQPVEVAFVLPSLSRPLAAYHFATPVQHVDTLRHIGVEFLNKADIELTNVVLKADITRPDGLTDALEKTLPFVPAGLDTFIYFPGYLPPAILGEFTVCFSNNHYAASTDTVLRKFTHTPYTFASDNFSTAPASGPDFWENMIYQQNAALYFTGPTMDKATHITFGLANADSIFIPEPGANTIGLVLYDADADSDSEIDLTDNFQDLNVLSLVTYEFDGAEPANVEIHVPLVDLDNNPYVDLKPRHPYYASLFYNGEAAATGRPLHFSRSNWEEYVNFPTTPLQLGSFYSGGWADGTVWQRLQVQGFSAVKTARSGGLNLAQVEVSPNPASETFTVRLTNMDGSFRVSLHDWQGRLLQSIRQDDAETNSMDFQVSQLPSGLYFLLVQTEKGSCLKKVEVCR